MWAEPLTAAAERVGAARKLDDVFSLELGWFPTTGMETVYLFHTGWARVLDIAHHLVLPAVTLSLFYMALYKSCRTHSHPS